MMEQRPKAVPFWNSHVSIMASNYSERCGCFPALLIIGIPDKQNYFPNDFYFIRSFSIY